MTTRVLMSLVQNQRRTLDSGACRNPGLLCWKAIFYAATEFSHRLDPFRAIVRKRGICGIDYFLDDNALAKIKVFP